MMKNVTHKAWRSGKKVLAAVLAFAIMIITLPISFSTNAASVSETDNPAFRVIAYDSSARIEIPAVEKATSYRVYLSPSDDTDLVSLTADAAARCALSCNTYQSHTYVLNGDTDALIPANTISILQNTAYYFYLVTNDGSADTLQASFEAKTEATADCYWTSTGHYDIRWYTADPDSNTYSIGTEAQLAGLAVLNNGLNGVSSVDFLGKTITITESLDLSAWLWTPIGTESKPFKGNISGIVYDAGGEIASCVHTVKGLHTNTDGDYQGLFGCTGGNSTIADIGIADSSIRGHFYVAGVVGWYSGAKMQNCSFTGSVNGNAEVGGVAGVSMGTIQDCYNTGKISGSNDVGGIAGYSVKAILDCNNTGSIDGYQYIGGIAGTIRFSPSRLYACYNTGAVSASYMEAGGIAGCSETCQIDSCYNSGSVYSANYSAGIAGAFYDTGYSLTNSCNTGFISGGYRIGGICGIFGSDSIDNCYNAGSVSNDQVTGSYLGGIVAIVQDGGAVNNCYYDKTVLSTDNGYGTGKTTDEMKALANTLGTAFVGAPSCYADGGVFSAGNPVSGGYPVLTAFGYTGGSNIDSQFDKESDTGYYLIKNAYQLDLMRNYSGSGNSGMVFKLAGNIDLSKAAYNNADLSWPPVGSESSPFCGTFNGGGYGVSGIAIGGWNFYQGLFGYTSGTIENLAVTDVNITGLGYEGAVAGYNTGVISHCSATGTVGGIILGDNIGGIVGNSEGAGSTVSGCCSACAVSGDGWIGGVVGYGDCTVSDCSNIGSVTGIVIAGSPGEASEIGGIAGVSSEYSLTDCRNKGTVCGNRNVGGVAGYLTCIDDDQTVSGCSNTGSVFGKSQTGGIVGDINRSCIKNCHNDGIVTGYASDSSDIGGIGGKIENSIRSCYNTGDVTGDSAVGGIAGTLNYVSSAYCYNTGAVTGTHSAGGIVGSGQYVTVQYSYNTGAVTSSQTAGGIVGTATEYPTVRCCYSTGLIQGTDTGGIGGNLSSSVQVNNNNYWGCGRGIGNMDNQSEVAEPFTALSSDSVKAAGTDSIIQSACILDAYDYDNQLGADFAVSYSYQSYSADIAAVSGLTITGGKIGMATITGTITITQNELNMQDGSGFTGAKKTITVPVSLPLTVTQATPTLAVGVSSSSAAVGDTLTLTADLSNTYRPTGTVTFYNDGTAIGSTDTISGSAASIDYVPSSTDDLSITAEYGGDTNNTEALSGNTQTVTIHKRSPALSAVTATPASPQNYPVSSVSLSATMSNYYGTLSGQTISFYNGDAYLGDAFTDENGTAVYILTSPGADTYQFAAQFAGDDNHNDAGTNGSTEYTVNKGTQNSLTVNGVPASVTYGDAAFKLSPSGGSGTGNTYTYDSSDENVLSVDRDGTVTITGAGSAIITVTKAGDDNYNPISTGISITATPKALDATITPQNKPYDTTTSAAVQEIEYAGIVGSDNVYIAGGTLSFQGKTAADDKTVTASGYGLSGTKATDYVLGSLTVNRADITKIPLTVFSTGINDKTYDGTTTAEFAGTPALSGVLSGDFVTLTSGTPSFADPNHSDRKIAVNFTEFSITGADSDNYTLVQPDSETAFIRKKELMVSVSPVTIDCGQAIPSLTVNVTGFVGGDSESTVTGFVRPAASQSYGSTTTPADNVSMAVAYSGGEATNNYEFQYTPTASLTKHAVYANDGDYSVTGVYSAAENPAEWNKHDFAITPCGDYDLISAEGTAWASTLTVDTETANGPISFMLKKSSDGTQTESKILYYNLDKTAPTGTISISGSDFKSFLNKITFGLFFKDTADVTIAGSDGLSGVQSIVYQKVASEADYDPDGAWTPYASFSVSPNKKFIVYAKITDNAGNETVINSNGVVVDNQAPTIAVSYPQNNQWTNDADAAVSVKVGENLAGIKGISYSIDGSAPTVSAQQEFTLSDLKEGNYPITVTASDLAGNTSSKTVTVKKDTAAPTGTISISGSDFKSFLNKITFGLFFKDTTDVTITGSDGLSGVQSIVYQKVASEADYDPDGAWTPYASFSVSPNEKFIVYAKITDNAGNETVINSNGVVVDNQAPTIAVSYPQDNQWTNDADAAVSVKVGENLAGIKDISYSIDSGAPTVSAQQEFTLSDLKDGNYPITVAASDLAGNTSSKTVTVKKDTAAPNGTISISGSDFKSFLNKITFGLFFKDTADVTITGSDGLSGVQSIVYQKVASEADYDPDGAWTPYAPFSVSPNEKFIVYAKIADNAGNETVINSNGVVLYTDSTLSADSADFDPNTAKPGYKDISVTANLNGNTVQDIQNGSYTLVKDKDYTMSGNTITFKKEYLKTAVSGTTVFLIHFSPLGETYRSGDEPAAAQFKITELVHAQTPEFQTDLSGEITYAKGETAAALTVNAAVSDGGTISYQWYVSDKPDTDGTPIEGVTSASYTPPTDTTGVFYCYVTATNTNRAVTGDKTATAVSSMVKVAVGNLDIPAADISGDAPQTSLQGSISDIRNAVLNDDDEKNLADGSRISIYLKVRIIDCPQDVQNSIASAADGNSVTEYLDISLFKRIDGAETKVDQTNSPLTVTLTLPEEIRDPSRCFSVVRVHDGTATLLTDLDNDPDTITFRSDSFSDYAIVYKDTAAETAPKTGNQYSAVPAFLLAGSLPLAWWLSSKRKRRWS